ncbi:MAG TPA: hypothetical protein VJR27_02230 [Candidatus Saccharimonadales bacterium]|nr:hypothetical protein [Candidatus Saccharimonadales bacterium]
MGEHISQSPQDFPAGLEHLTSSEHAANIRELATTYREKLGESDFDPQTMQTVAGDIISAARQCGIPDSQIGVISVLALTEIEPHQSNQGNS